MAWRCGHFQPQSHAAVERLSSGLHASKDSPVNGASATVYGLMSDS
jgi:hypothetical protein